MQQRDMGVPLGANVDAETQGMIFRETKVIRSSFIHEGERRTEPRTKYVPESHLEWLATVPRSRAVLRPRVSEPSIPDRDYPYRIFCDQLTQVGVLSEIFGTFLAI
jgi:hypothetical protein